MSQPIRTRDQIRSDQYKLFRGYICQELATARRWSTYSPCDFTWLCEFEDNPHLYTIIKHLLKQNEYDFNSITSQNIRDILLSLDQEVFLQCLVYIERHGSLNGFQPVTVPANCFEMVDKPGDQDNIQQTSVLLESSDSASSYECISHQVECSLDERALVSEGLVSEPIPQSSNQGVRTGFSVTKEDTYNFVRSESLQISMMNKHADESIPCVVVANWKIRNFIEETSPHPIRNYDYRLEHYSPITVTSDASLLRCGRNKIVILFDGSTLGIRNSGLLKYHTYTGLDISSDGKFVDMSGSINHFLNDWLSRHHFGVTDGDLTPIDNSTCETTSRLFWNGYRNRHRLKHLRVTTKSVRVDFRRHSC